MIHRASMYHITTSRKLQEAVQFSNLSWIKSETNRTALRYASTISLNAGASLVLRRFRLGHSWTLPWTVMSPRDTRRKRNGVLAPALCQTSRGQRIKRERLGTMLYYTCAGATVTPSRPPQYGRLQLLLHLLPARGRWAFQLCWNARTGKPEWPTLWTLRPASVELPDASPCRTRVEC